MKRDEKILRVAEARTYDVGTGLVRLDSQIMRILNLSQGDYVQITGRRRTAAILGSSLPEDENRGVIRMDGIQRRNAGASLDDKIGITKILPKQCSKVTVAPLEELKLSGAEEYVSTVLDGKVISKGDVFQLNVMGNKVELMVTGFVPSGPAAIVSRGTKIIISAKAVKEPVSAASKVSYEDIGGLEGEVKKVREMIELPLKHPELFERLGVEAPKGVLLHGPPGTGKTLLAKAVASETNANFTSIGGPEIMSKFYGESEERLREIFKQAEENAPSIIFIDEIDSIAPKRDEVTGETERRVVAQLLALMDGLESRGKVVVIGATNRPNAIDAALRRPGRFDREIEIGVPDKKSRLEILQIHTRGMPMSDDVNLQKLAEMTHGYVGADLWALCKEAAIRSLRKILPAIDIDSDTIPADVLRSLKVTMDDFTAAFREMSPSGLREVLVEKPNVTWDDIGGLHELKEELQQAIEWPMKYGVAFEKLDVQPPRGILLHGPPGTGKTLLAKAVAHESEANFINVKGPEFLSKWVGESEKAVRETFRKARQAAPCVIFIDEIDAIVPMRGSGVGDAQVTERVVSQLLTELDGLEELHGVSVIAATNRPDIIDPALLRPGRFDRLIYVPLPDQASRKAILAIHTGKKPLSKDVSIERLAEKMENYTGAEIAAVCNQAAMIAMKKYIDQKGKIDEESLSAVKVTNKDFDEAMKKVKPLSKEDISRYAEMSKKFKSDEPFPEP
ncbi:MAG: CDC48 family AAA ATPase [Thermoplasmata archaeon]|jgi:transitional endoplasmic reticulum ATPase|nr:CDC48 family AAA ATPase [Candidatus Sysuiplasma jiujiangense]